jgi:cyclic beta-1,2-glucan synthetase
VFAAAIPPPASGSPPAHRQFGYSGDRAAFIGHDGSVGEPAAIAAGGPLDGRSGANLDPCFAHSTPVELPPGATTQVCFLLGEAEDQEDARALVSRYAAAGAPAAALARVREYWQRLRERVVITTPSPALDLMVNGWLPYQTMSCRLWGRTAFYQSGGAFGFRDQLQDAASLVHHAPELTRAQILLHAAHQFVEGDVLHWWHPPQSLGLRTRCSDDLLWLPHVTAMYIAATGDWRILDEPVGFLSGQVLAPEEDEILLTPAPAAEVADLYTHCCRAIDRGVTSGRHGLPLFGTCDWNDGMNRVGRKGIGESVWLGFFAYAVLGDFLPICAHRDDAEREDRYRAQRAALATALNDAGWDGDWYRRGYYDSGAPLGSSASDECRIDALAQAWSVISGVAPAARAVRALDAVEEHLISDRDRIIRLLTPPFDRTAEDPGYIKGYVPGARENGGQYTHAALWVVKAMAELRRPDRAAELLDYLNPILHASTRERADRYEVEPYVIAADIHGVPPHVGRGGWTWYTGSAGWMIRVALESVLGFRVAGGKEIVLSPCVPKHWERFAITYRPPGTDSCYAITAVNPGRDGSDLIAATLDGAPLAVVDAGADGAVTGGAGIGSGANGSAAVRVPIARDGCTHRVELLLGARAAVTR